MISKKYFFRTLFICAFLSKSFYTSAQLVVDTVPTAAQVISSLQGPGVTISNLTINCHPEAYGTFNATATSLGSMTSGLLLTSGYASSAVGPDNSGIIASQCWGTTSTDTNLTAIINTGTTGVAVHDACIMNFDITPSCDSLSLNFVFGSEEYPVFVNSFNDGFGFWISGPNPSGGSYNNMNLALIPGTATPVTINNVNDGNSNTGPCVNCAYYVNNTGGLTIYYNGLTVPITAHVHVVPCQTYHMEIGIADAGDCAYDSGVFLTYQGLRCSNSITKVSPRDTSICPGQSVPLTASGTGNYSWGPAVGLSSTSGSSVTATPSVTTTYTVTGYSTTTCGTYATSDSVTIFIGIPGFHITPAAPAICQGDSVKLTASGAASYVWSPATGLSSTTDSVVYAKPTATTSYTVTGTSTLGCPSVASAIITVHPTPVITINPAAPFLCMGDSIKLIGHGAKTYSWLPITNLNSGTGDTVVAKPLVTTTYTVTAIDSNGCKSAPTTVTIQVSTPLIVKINAGYSSVCAGGQDSLNSTVSGGNGSGYIYSWTPTTGLSSSTTSKVSTVLSSSTTYTLTVKDACGDVSTDTLTVGINPNPIVAFTTNKKSGCTPVCIVFTDSSKISAGNLIRWQWNFGNGKISYARDTDYCYTTSGSYNVHLQVMSNKGCITNYNGIYTIVADPLPMADFTYSPNPTNILQPLITFKDISSGAINWQWNFGDKKSIVGEDTSNLRNPTHTYQDTGTYCVKLTVMNTDSCYASNEYCLVIQPDWAIYVPNAFTPNGDGLNDVFLPQGFGLNPDGFQMYIFDRWGSLVYQTNDITKGWNGHANNGSSVAQEDVYVWKIIVKDVLGNVHQYTGKVSIVR